MRARAIFTLLLMVCFQVGLFVASGEAVAMAWQGAALRGSSQLDDTRLPSRQHIAPEIDGLSVQMPCHELAPVTVMQNSQEHDNSHACHHGCLGCLLSSMADSDQLRLLPVPLKGLLIVAPQARLVSHLTAPLNPPPTFDQP